MIRFVFRDFLKMIFSSKEDFEDTWETVRQKLLLLYEEALSSDGIHLTQMIQVCFCSLQFHY